ncbi:MAG: hypothetical protein HHAS10_00560 [Candidatus Altimarinota bacterium]
MKTFFLFLLLTFPFGIFAQTVESDNFILTDGHGHTTAQLTKSGEGSPALFFYDTKGTPRISIGLYGDGVPGIVLNDQNGLATALLRMVNNQGEPVLVLKEYGQDKLIIDKDGARDNLPMSRNGGFTLNFIFGILGGLIGGFLASSYMKRINVKNSFSPQEY